MAVIPMLDLAREEMAEVFEQRAAPDDHVMWDLSVGATAMMCENSEGESHLHHQSVYSLYVCIDCPESGDIIEMVSVTPLTVDISIEEWANDVWEAIALQRIEIAEGLEVGHDEG